MSEKYKNKYRIDSTRLKNWDYQWNAAYFITICTKNRINYFGNVVNGKMGLNEIGKIAETEWLKTFEMRPDMNLIMGNYVIMPNHFHAIIIIGENQYNSRRHSPPMNSPENNPAPMDAAPMDAAPMDSAPMDAAHVGSAHCSDAMHCVSSNDPINDPIHNSKNQFGPQSKNLASIIRGFKMGVTSQARIINPQFAWQPLYHEHIIRDDRSFRNISNYIINNPANWQKDKFV